MTFIAPQVDTYPYFGSGDDEYAVRNLYTNFGQKTVAPRAARRKVVEIERIALDVVSCGHVLQDDDLAVDSLETSGGWNELEPRVQEIGPALPLEDDLFLFTQNQKRISTSAASQGETLGNPKLDSPCVRRRGSEPFGRMVAMSAFPLLDREWPSTEFGTYLDGGVCGSTLVKLTATHAPFRFSRTYVPRVGPAWLNAET